MRIRIRHETTYRYQQPAKTAIQHLRLTPRNYDGQHVVDWRIDVDRDCRLMASEDAYGNILHRFSAEGPLDGISTIVEGEVTTFDTNGVVSGAVERFPPAFYLRETSLTLPSQAIQDYARGIAANETTTLAKLHALVGALYEQMTFDADATHAATTAAQCFEQKSGVCQDFAHLFISCAKVIGAPARYVSGYFLRDDTDDQVAGHAWAEAYVTDLGWVGFDPSHGLSPGETYVRLAAALDYLSAAPIRGARIGGAGESMDVRIHVSQAQGRAQAQHGAQQNQSQTQ